MISQSIVLAALFAATAFSICEHGYGLVNDTNHTPEGIITAMPFGVCFAVDGSVNNKLCSTFMAIDIATRRECLHNNR